MTVLRLSITLRCNNEQIIIKMVLYLHEAELWVGWGYCVERHFQQYFSYIVAVSFIGGVP